MGCLYVVRCNFAEPDELDPWQRWYSGEKQDWLLSRPGFVAGQRFEAVGCTDGVRFLALYALASPGALTTPEYASGWGWGDWRPFVVDWSRNLFDALAPDAFLTGDGEALRVVFVGVDGDLPAAEAARPGLRWTRVAGLDGSLSAIGLARGLARRAGGALPAGVSEGVFRPASPPRYGDRDTPGLSARKVPDT